MFDVNQITSTLRGMPDRLLQQYAMMNKGNPYVLSLAVAESNQRKQLRQAAQARMAGQQMPKVVDQDIAGMAEAPAVDAMGNVTGMAAGGLPEDSGIGRLPAPNIQRMADGGIAGYGDDENNMAQGGMFEFAQHSEPVLRMASGGIPGFAKGDGIKVYEDRIRAEAERQGVDPNIAVRMFKRESGGDRYAVSPKGAAGLGQLMPDTAAEMGLSAEDRFDPDKNIPASVGYLKKQLIKYKGDPEKALAAYNWGAGNVDKHLAKNEGRLNRVGLPKETADYLNTILPIGTAQAETAPAKQKAAVPADTSLAAQIPGQSYIAPAKKEPGGFLSSDWFEQKAEDLGLSRDVGRNVANTLNAPTPLAPATGVAKSSSSVAGIPALFEKLGTKLGFAKVPGRLSEAEIAALQKESAGLRALEAGPQAVKGAQEAGATLEEQEYLRKMIEARKAKEAPSAAQKIAEASQAREAQDVATAQRLSQAGQEAQASARTGALADKAFPAGDMATPPVDPSKLPFKGITGNEMERMQEANQAPITRENVVDAAKEATPESKRKGFTDDDLLTLGLSLLANKNPNFLTALGESGLAAVAGKKEREKIEREEAKLKGTEELQKAQAKYYGAYGEAIERGAKEKNETLAAEKMVQDAISKWETSMPGKMAMMNDPNAKAREEDRIRTAIFAQLGITPIMTKQSAAPSGGGGFKFLGVN